MTRTYLRIKRRRTEEPLPFIRLEALNHPRGAAGAPPYSNKKRGRTSGDGKLADLDSDSLSDFLDPDQQHEARPHHSSTSVLWKRLEPLREEAESCRIVDALLENPEEDDGRQNKRRKLTLLETSNRSTILVADKSSPIKRRPALRVLDPLARLVDDSLQEVHAGVRPVSEHYRFITTDSRLAGSHDTKKWVLWCHSSGGNLLHSCALWNDTEMAGDVLQVPTLAGPLCEALDGDGRTPYEVAQLSGHDSVCQILEAFGGDTTNYVYDIFCLEEADNEMIDDEKYGPTTVELASGVAYWTPDGELMLEASSNNMDAYLDDNDGEIDSNCEDYDANDYPDEEEDAAWGYENRAHHLPHVAVLDHNQDHCALDRQFLHKDIYAEDAEDNDDMVGGAYGGFDTRPYAAANDM
jgi:hypothetical protein